MKVLLINGSPRKKGNTFLALSEAAKTLEQQGIETEIVQIGVKPVRGCRFGTNIMSSNQNRGERRSCREYLSACLFLFCCKDTVFF